MSRRLDAALFLDTGWFAIDPTNRRVPGVVMPSLEAGLALVGRGAVATLVGRLRPEVMVVDIDLTGEAGWSATESLAGWCTRESLWHLVRPSGGADGRAHVFIAHDGRRDALERFLTDLRAAHRASAATIDLRSMVRPLSAPHRNGTHTEPLQAATAWDHLTALAWVDAPSPPRARAKTTTTRRPPVAPLEPSRRRERRPLPPAWQRFLDTGERPSLRPPAPGAPEHTRSTWEAIATATMLRAGWSVDEAWAAIETAHPAAMDHARADRRRWVRWVWNRAVLDDADYRPPRPRNPAVEAAVAQARDRLRTTAWSLSRRRRHALLLVGHALLDRMSRTGTLRVPCPERNLVLDTGLSDRTTIRTQLRLLHGELGQLHRTFKPTQKDTSSYEFEIPPARPQRRGVSQLPPPSRHTPLSPAALPACCPPCAAHLLRALRERATPADTATLARQSQLTHSPTTPLTPGQLRTIRAGLEALARLGLARCSETGEWVACEAIEASELAAGQARYEHLAARVHAERTAYRNQVSMGWHTTRAVALKANRAREQAWWHALSEHERRVRRREWQQRFAQLSAHAQAQVKASLTERDRCAGIDVAARHDQWLNTMDPATLEQRCVRRAADFAALPHPLRVAHARAWQEHRRRFGIPRGTPAAATRLELQLVLPASSAARDQDFMQRQLPGLHADAVGFVS